MNPINSPSKVSSLKKVSPQLLQINILSSPNCKSSNQPIDMIVNESESCRTKENPSGKQIQIPAGVNHSSFPSSERREVTPPVNGNAPLVDVGY